MENKDLGPTCTITDSAMLVVGAVRIVMELITNGIEICPDSFRAEAPQIVYPLHFLNWITYANAQTENEKVYKFECGASDHWGKNLGAIGWLTLKKIGNRFILSDKYGDNYIMVNGTCYHVVFDPSDGIDVDGLESCRRPDKFVFNRLPK